MLKIKGTINDRSIHYLDIQDDLTEFEQLELQSWVTLVIADDISHPLLKQFAELSIDMHLLYMAAVGKACSHVDDLFDMVMVERKIEGRKIPDWCHSEEDTLMTTWHHDFSEGFWFLTTIAQYEDHPISTVLIANFTDKSYFDEIQQLTDKIQTGWLPNN